MTAYLHRLGITGQWNVTIGIVTAILIEMAMLAIGWCVVLVAARLLTVVAALDGEERA